MLQKFVFGKTPDICASTPARPGRWVLPFVVMAIHLALAGAAGADVSTFAPHDIGAPSAAGSATRSDGRIELTSTSSGIGFKSDQFQFFSGVEAGDFDVRVRVEALKNTDLWAKAGLMLRSGLEEGAAFAAVFATPSGAGCLFQSRVSAGANTANQGAFPANQPFTWLRLRRQGDAITGFAGYDGKRWTLLGAATANLGTAPELGLAVTSHSTNATRVLFREFGNATDAKIERVRSKIEPPGPSSRRSAIVISEIHYHPEDRADGKDLKFVEIYNSQPHYEDISGWKLRGDISFMFPEGTVISGGGFLIVAAVPTDVLAVYGLESVLGPYEGKLNNAGGSLRLLGERDAVLFDVEYSDDRPWPKLADGTGHSLVLVRPSYGEADPRAWSASRVRGGSPGAVEAFEVTPTADVRINECQLPDAAGGGFFELFNAGSMEADLSGVRVGDAPDSLPFVIPPGTKLPPGGFASFTLAQSGISLKSSGDKLYLLSADASRFLDAVTFAPQSLGTSAGRWPNGADWVLPLPKPTASAANPRPNPEIVITEIHHSPITGDALEEFVELYNPGSQRIDLSFWEFTAGISFRFPQGTSIAPGGYLVAAHNAARFKQLYPNVDPAVVLGDFSGKLRSSEQLILSKPVTVRTASGRNDLVLVPVTEVSFTGAGRWNQYSDAGGSSLELLDLRSNVNSASSWADSDEAGKSGWTTVEFTGVLDNGASGGGGGGGRPGGGGGGTALAPDSLHIILLGEGECLIDNVEVIGPGATNRISNGTFEGGVSGWTFSGNHIRTSLETGEGDASAQSLHLRASGNGDTGANKIFVKLSQALASGNTATLRARVKWLRGWPEILLRLHGNSLEAFGRLAVPAASGTPGAKNSRALANSGPAVSGVTHFPAVPAGDEPVLVTALVDDPDGVGPVTLRYRTDPDQTLTSVPMRDDGTGGDAVPGDGIFSAVIPAPGTAGLVAFTITAEDAASVKAATVFPPGAPERECLVRFGDGVQSGAFGIYRLWVTKAWSDAWANRPILSNEAIESTFVYADSRVVYNAGGRFAGSPYHQNFQTGPSSQAHFTIELPKDDRVLGASAFNKLHAPGNGAFDDQALQREQVVYWLARKSGLPWLHRRFFHFYVNGAKKQNLMEDTQVGGNDFVEEFWPKDTGGDLFKMQPWFEFADGTAKSLQMQNSTFVTLSRFTTTGGEYKLARYRWNWLTRGVEGTANDYTKVLQLITAVTDTANPTYEAEVEKLVDVDEWFRFFSINHAVGNWDSVGYRNAQNTYSYKPENGRWELIIWDANIVLGNGSDNPTSLPLFTTGDTTLNRWFTQGGFRRRFLSAYHELVNGPMKTDLIAPILDAKYAAFQEHGVTAQSPASIKTWITSARNYIVSQIAKDSADFAVTGVEGNGSLTVSGTGPLNMTGLQINGTPVPLSWTSTKTWTATFTPAKNAAVLTLAALDRKGAVVPGTVLDYKLSPPGRLAIALAADAIVLQYTTARTGTFQLQAAESVLSPVWKTVSTQEAVGGGVTFRVPLGGGLRKAEFYRVLEP